MPNNYLSVLYQHIIQVENKNVGLKVEGHKHTIAPPVKKVGGGHMPPLPPRFLRQCIYIYIYIYIWGGGRGHVLHGMFVPPTFNPTFLFST